MDYEYTNCARDNNVLILIIGFVQSNGETSRWAIGTPQPVQLLIRSLVS